MNRGSATHKPLRYTYTEHGVYKTVAITAEWCLTKKPYMSISAK